MSGKTHFSRIFTSAVAFQERETFPAYQLDVVDAFLGELLEGFFGRVLQGESEALNGLVLALHDDICLHLQGAPSKAPGSLSSTAVHGSVACVGYSSLSKRVSVFICLLI